MLVKILVFIITGLLLISCNDKKTEPVGLITTISQSFLDDEELVKKSLLSIGLEYQPGYKRYDSKKLLVACEADQLSILKDSEAKITEIEKSLMPDSDRYREKAIDFFRKIQDAKKSLSAVNTLLQPYCENEHKLIQKCFIETEPILVHINHHVSSFMTVHPVIIPNRSKETGLYLLQSDEVDEDYIRSYDLKDGREKKHYSAVLAEITSVEQMGTTFQCLSKIEIKTEVGQKIKATARIGFQLGRKDCALLKSNLDDAARRSKAENFEIKVWVSDEQKAFCGDLLK